MHTLEYKPSLDGLGIPRIGFNSPTLADFRKDICEFLAHKCNEIAKRKAGDEPISDTFSIAHSKWGLVGFVKLDVRTAKGKVLEKHVYVESANGNTERIDAQTPFAASFFLAGCVA